MSQEAPPLTSDEWKKIAYDPNPPEMPDDTKKLFETYSQIRPEQVLSHVIDIRERAFQAHPYPCLGHWRFLHLAIGRHPLYAEVLRRMRTGDQILLDLGCAVAQDIRRLVADGVDSSKCYGSDLLLEFLDLGYELFNDKETLKTHFIEADIFDEDSELNQLNHKVDIINASSFFHLFGWEQQKQIARRCTKLLTGRKDNLIIGRQVGNDESGEVPKRDGQGARFRHNIESWRRMWKEVGQETGIDLLVEGQFTDMKGIMPGAGRHFGREEGTKMMVFSVRRII
ncbi:hypothetical protein AMS68_001067 [Peltaster fructicola]|uniref:Methyltransferase domain-containing protein n=1 Tax=Peltaster fructicola TaxID=286661 RepID=A0A6H0XM24_9PEZI|nr:hypothetical protein AMS68_001067 [Peltaster fructicola]